MSLSKKNCIYFLIFIVGPFVIFNDKLISTQKLAKLLYENYVYADTMLGINILIFPIIGSILIFVNTLKHQQVKTIFNPWIGLSCVVTLLAIFFIILAWGTRNGIGF